MSTGVDGDLIINTPGVTVLTLMPQGGGTIFNFKSIQIAAGSTLKLSGQIYSNPLYFLAQNAVMIAGTIDLTGANGEADNQPITNRIPSVPGPGGFSGGLGSFGTIPAQPGNGPGGGAAPGGTGCFRYAVRGTFIGNQFLVPLIGGSGGAGGTYGPGSPNNGGGGGAGGGALLIASSVSITVTGSILADAGYGSNGAGVPPNSIPYSPGGSGSGGAIRLVAPVISGSGTLSAQGTLYSDASGCGTGWGGGGVIRLEAFQQSFTGTIPSVNVNQVYAAKIYYGTPFGLFLPTASPSVRVVSVGGVPVNSSPSGSFIIPDVTVNSSGALLVQIQAQNVPLGTTVTLMISSQNGPDQTIISTGVAGTLANSTASATIPSLPSGFSQGYVKASWIQ